MTALISIAAAFVAIVGSSTLAEAAPCTPNLKPSIASPLRTVRRPFEHRPASRFTVRVDNPTACPATSRIGIKPLMMPAQDTIQHGDHTHPSGDGRVLPTTFVDLDIPPGESRTYLVSGRLPPLEWQAWRLTAIVDSAQQLAETNELDGVPDLVSAGYLGVARGNPPEDGIDFTSTIPSRPTKQGGGVDHTLGLHSRPDVPPFTLDSRDVGVRFLLADITTNKVYTLIYRQAKTCAPDCDPGLTCDNATSTCLDSDGNPVPEIDKEYFAISWAPDVDELGRAVVTDIYWQAPQFVDATGQAYVPPGKYRFLSIMDSWDRVPEFDESDNIDALPFTLAPLEIVGFPNTWFVATAASPPSQHRSVQLRNSYSADLPFTVSIPASAPWLTVTPSSGNLAIDTVADLTVMVDRGTLPPGDYDADVTITATGFEQFPIVVPVSFYVYDTAVPRFKVTPTVLDFSTTIGVHPPLQQVTVSDPGALPLEWEAWPNVEWISVQPPYGEGPAGYSEQVSLIVHPEGLAPGGPYVGTVSLFSNAPGGTKTVTARLVVGPCEDGFCEDGWLCSGTTHLCEPPQTCTTHAQCPLGQDCAPTGVCEVTGPCMSDDDCQWVFGPWGALACNLGRMTCELASCTADPDCPIGSYCDEPTSVCPVSGVCTSNDDCFGEGAFAMKCDVPRTSCIPAVCTSDPACPAASYCSTQWNRCVSSAHCISNQDCFDLGMACDIPRDACHP